MLSIGLIVQSRKKMPAFLTLKPANSYRGFTHALPMFSKVEMASLIPILMDISIFLFLNVTNFHSCR